MRSDCHNTTVGLIVMCVVKRDACGKLAALLMLTRYTADLAVTPASVNALVKTTDVHRQVNSAKCLREQFSRSALSGASWDSPVGLRVEWSHGHPV